MSDFPPVYELRFYTGTRNWVCEGRGYWLSSIGEFSKLIPDHTVSGGRRFECIEERVYYENKDWVQHRPLTEEEIVIYNQMKAILDATKAAHPEGV